MGVSINQLKFDNANTINDQFCTIQYNDYESITSAIRDGWKYAGDELWYKTKTSCSEMFLPFITDNCIGNNKLWVTFPNLKDAHFIYENEKDKYLREHSLFDMPNLEDIERMIIDSYPNWLIGESSILIAREKSDGEPLAKLCVRKLVPPGVIDVGYTTMAKHRGNGVGFKLLKLFTKWAFESADIQRIELGIKPQNLSSIKTAMKAGYHFESVRHSRLFNVTNSYSDEHSYVALKVASKREWSLS